MVAACSAHCSSMLNTHLPRETNALPAGVSTDHPVSAGDNPGCGQGQHILEAVGYLLPGSFPYTQMIRYWCGMHLKLHGYVIINNRRLGFQPSTACVTAHSCMGGQTCRHLIRPATPSFPKAVVCARVIQPPSNISNGQPLSCTANALVVRGGSAGQAHWYDTRT